MEKVRYALALGAVAALLMAAYNPVAERSDRQSGTPEIGFVLPGF